MCVFIRDAWEGSAAYAAPAGLRSDQGLLPKRLFVLRDSSGAIRVASSESVHTPVGASHDRRAEAVDAIDLKIASFRARASPIFGACTIVLECVAF